MSGKEMYERNPFSSFFFSFILEKRMQKEMTIRGTPFHTVLDLSSNCEVACSLSRSFFFEKKRKKEQTNIHCLFATFPKTKSCFSAYQKTEILCRCKKKKKEEKSLVVCLFLLGMAKKKKKKEESPLLVEQFLSKPSVRLQVGHHW